MTLKTMFLNMALAAHLHTPSKRDGRVRAMAKRYLNDCDQDDEGTVRALSMVKSSRKAAEVVIRAVDNLETA